MKPKTKRRTIKLTPVEELPKVRNVPHQHDLCKIFDEFMSMPNKIVRVELDINSYTNIKAAYASFNQSAVNYCYPIKVVLRQGDIYFVKKNIM